MVLRKTLLSCVALGALTCGSLLQANAQTQLSFTGGIFNFSGSTFSITTDVVFSYSAINGTQYATAVPDQQAVLTLSGNIGAATEYTLNGSQVGVNAALTNVSETITGASGSLTGANLVSFSNQSATLSGAGSTINFTLSSPSSIFSSDIFALAGPENTTLQLSPSSVLSVTGTTTSYSGAYGTASVITGTLGSFSATGGANVFNAASVPEASTLLGLGGLVLGGGFIGLRRRK